MNNLSSRDISSNNMLGDVDRKLTGLVIENARMTTVLLAIAGVVILFLLWKMGTFNKLMGKDSFADANAAKKYSSFGFSGSENYMRERATDRVAGGTAFKDIVYDPAADPTNPNSLNYQILNSADFSCGMRTPVTDKPWEFLVENAGKPEGMSNRDAAMDADLSRVLAGVANK